MIKANASQQKAILYPNQNKSIFAPPGTGKTITVTLLVASILSTIDPQTHSKHLTSILEHEEDRRIAAPRVLMISFMKKSIADLKRKLKVVVQDACGLSTGNVMVRSYHSLAQWVVNFHQRGTRKPEHKQLKLLSDKQILKIISDKLKPEDVSNILTPQQIDSVKEKAMNSFWKVDILKSEEKATCQKIKSILQRNVESGVVYPQHFNQKKSKAYDYALPYIRYLLDYYKNNGLITYNQLLRRCYIYLQECLHTRNYFQQFFTHVIIDQFQDSSQLQYNIVSLLAHQAYLTVVGDDDQSIYEWRQAKQGIFSQFFNDRPHHSRYTLNVNYRSQQKIIDFGKCIIDKIQVNQKRATAASIADCKIELQKCYSTQERLNFIIETIKKYKQNDQRLKFSDFAVVSRFKKDLTQLRSAIKKKPSIPFRFIDIDFTQTKQFKDIDAIIRYVIDPSQKQLVKHILNIQNKTFGKGISYEGYLKNKQKQARLQKETDRLRMLIENYPPKIAIEQLLKRIGYSQTIKKRYNSKGLMVDEEQANEKQEAMAHMLSIFDITSEQLDPQLQQEGEPENIALMKLALERCMIDSEPEKEGDGKVIVTTIHKTKGLEYKAVFLLDLWRFLSKDTQTDQHFARTPEAVLKQERRLLYVAITRAKTHLYLMYRFEDNEIYEQIKDLIQNEKVEINIHKRYRSYSYQQYEPTIRKVSNKWINILLDQKHDDQ